MICKFSDVCPIEREERAKAAYRKEHPANWAGSSTHRRFCKYCDRWREYRTDTDGDKVETRLISTDRSESTSA